MSYDKGRLLIFQEITTPSNNILKNFIYKYRTVSYFTIFIARMLG
jgi:hypothetical protein